MALELVGIGGMGLMMSPSAKHLTTDGPSRYKRIHDRGTKDERRDACRRAWRDHGAELVTDFNTLIGEGDFDGIVICAGKNGDDLEIIRSIVPLIPEKKERKYFILHMSTVSAGFVEAAGDFLSSRNIDYVNYPLTGGPLGAETAKMLILAGGDRTIYNRLEPMLKVIGNPQYFGPAITRGAEVKLIGQLMVFNGLMGISSAAALKTECFNEPLVGAEQADFFDFLNNGAGGTRQWDVALTKGVREDIWNQGFMIHHAVVDAIYAAALCKERGIPATATFPLLAIAASFAFILKKHGAVPIATHAIAREFLKKNARDIDTFAGEIITFPDIESSLERCTNALPEKVRQTIALDVSPQSFGP